MREPTDIEQKMLATYEHEMIAAGPLRLDETDAQFVRRASKPILEREGLTHFLCRRCWQWHHRETTIYWPGICDICDAELRQLDLQQRQPPRND